MDPKQGRIKLKKGTSGKKVRSRITTRIRRAVPVKGVRSSLAKRGFLKLEANGKTTSKPIYGIINMDHSDIVTYYNAVVRGRVNYYSFADNRSSLRSMIWQRHNSCMVTLMQKYKRKSIRQVIQKFGKRRKDPHSDKKRHMPEHLKRIREFRRGKQVNLSSLELSWANKRTHSNLNKSCLICGSREEVEIHHIRSLADIKRKMREGDTDGSRWVSLQRAAINRKQVPLCQEHHQKVHNDARNRSERKRLKQASKSIVQRKPE